MPVAGAWGAVYTEAMPVTRDDVARAAGVSVATVSYVLNAGPRGVSDEKRQRVLQAVAELGYRPNAIARSLRARRTNILGLVLPNSASPYFAALAHAIEEAAAARGYQVVVSNASDSPEREAAQIEALLRLRVDGLVWIPADLRSTERHAARAVRPDVPTVQVDRALAGGGDSYDVVVPDNAGGGRLAADHLVALGHRRVAVVAG
ncbi:MAG: LacI family DNA-binding transcriptional regulator, partial [Chloroflexota bacterium]